jgi:hypothetical protein
MAWIKTIGPGEGDETLARLYREARQLYPAEYAESVPALTRADGTSESIMQAHSLLPEVMFHVFAAFGKLMAPELPLTRRQHEMIATLVSSLNRCFY